MKLKLKNVSIVDLSLYPGEQGVSQVLVLSTTLTPAIATELRCREVCYDLNNVPRKFDTYPTLSVRIDGADVELGDFQARADLVHKFKISQPRAKADNDVALQVDFRLRFTGDVFLADFVKKYNKNEFPVLINARQEDFDFGEPEEEEQNLQEPEPEAAAKKPRKQTAVQ